MTDADKASDAGQFAAELAPEREEELRRLWNAGKFKECYEMAQRIIAERYIR